MISTILVSGTWGLNGGRWWAPESPFWREAKKQGVQLHPAPFVWSTAIDGILGKNSEWTDAAGALLAFCAYHKLDLVNIISHSHGFSPCVYAATMGLKIKTLVAVAPPVRREVVELLPLGRKSVGRLVEIRGGRRDLMQLLGALFDGRLGFYRDLPGSEKIIEPEGTHSGLLNPCLWTQ